ncbi:MAG: Cof-type HAD-IIB family hydrolase [Alistipes sp.]|nr:Cof-type HAD-IIB family hydrolase [Alistipes sp.]
MDIEKIILLSDMDGTLLTSKKTISGEDMAAIEKFIDMGGKFTVATGRTIQSFRQYRSILPLHMPVIMYNGGGIYDYSQEKLLCSSPLPAASREMSMELLRLMPETGGEVLTDKGTYVFSNTEYQQLHTRLCGITPEYMSLPEIPEGGWLKVLFALAPEDIPHLQLLTEQLGYTGEADFVRSSDIFLEMLPKGVSKGSALAEYRKLEGMEDFTFIAVGDFDNDLEMIQAADIGVCPANAEESVKNAADIVLTRTNDEGALAELIQRITDNSLSYTNNQLTYG